MIYMDLNGRLGNNLYQIATVASLAKANNVDYRLVCIDRYFLSDDMCYLSEYIKQYEDTFFKGIEVVYEYPENYIEYNESDYTYTKIEFQDNMLLRGWFQSEKYFDKDLVRKMFKMPAGVKDYISKKYEHIFNQGPINSIHVRRGDYMNVPHEFMICSLSYYKKAIKLLGKDKRYLLISDDIAWCKQNFIGDNFYFVDEEKPIIHMYIQSFCENNIISNSTFAWWSAWLNPHPHRKVVYPAKWFGMKFRKNKIIDLIPDGWIKVNNRLTFDLQIKAIRFYTRDKYREKKRALRKKLRPVKRFFLGKPTQLN